MARMVGWSEVLPVARPMALEVFVLEEVVGVGVVEVTWEREVSDGFGRVEIGSSRESWKRMWASGGCRRSGYGF